MKKILYATLVALAVFVSQPVFALSSSAAKKKVVAVPLFVNSTSGNSLTGELRSGDYELPDQASEIAADATSSALLDTRAYRILNRSNSAVKSLDTERAFAAVEGNSPVMTVLSDLKNMNVDYLLLGRINRYRIDAVTAEAYGVRRMQVTVSVSMDMQLLDVETGEVVLNKNMSERIMLRIPQGIDTMSTLKDWEPVMRKAIDKSVPEFVAELNEDDDDDDMPGSRKGASKKMVSFEVRSIPSGADVEFDGCFVGNTPCTVEAPAVSGVLKVSAAGYLPWQKKIVPNAKLKISPTLQPDRDSSKKKSKKKKAPVVEEDDDEEDTSAQTEDEEEEAPAPKKKTKKKATPVIVEDDDEEE